MSIDFVSRILGMVVFAILGAQLGVSTSVPLGLPQLATSFIFSLVGVLFGLIVTPWITVRPIRAISRTISVMPMEVLFTTLLGAVLGLLGALLLAYPFSLLEEPWGNLLPAGISIVMLYMMTTIFHARSREVWTFLNEWLNIGSTRLATVGDPANEQFLLDTSVLIDAQYPQSARR